MYAAHVVAKKVSEMGEEKTLKGAGRVFLAAILGGVFIGLGYYIHLESIHLFPHSPIGQVLGALLFPTGIMLVLFTGAELFTGNCLMTLGYLDNRYKMTAVLKNWIIVYVGNFIGAILLAFLIKQTGFITESRLETLMALVEPKLSRTFIEAFTLGFLCNVLVAIAVYSTFASYSEIGQFVTLWFPITLFVLAGFEHSIANMFILPLGLFSGMKITWETIFIKNILPVTFGNITSGALFIPILYYMIYIHDK